MGDNGASSDAAPVVITGTSTGIGAASALLLAEKGFRVFAGVRNAADGDALVARSSGELTPIPIDITDEPSISAAVDVVEGAVGQRGLFGLVNNAGIVKPGPLELQPMADFRRQLEVNLIGQVADDPGVPPADPSRQGPNRQRRVDRRPCGVAASWRVQRVEVRHGGGQRRPAARASAMEHPCFAHRSGRHRDRHLRQDARRDRRDGEDASRERTRASTTGSSPASGAWSRRPPPTRRRSTTSPRPLQRRSRPRSRSRAIWPATVPRRRWRSPAQRPTG